MDVPLQEPIFRSFWAALQEQAGSSRAFRRISLNLPIIIGIMSNQPPSRAASPAKSAVQSAATLTDASVSGFCFSSLEQFPEDTIVVVELELGRQIHRVPAVVRRCAAQKKLGRTFYECGAQYIKSEAAILFVPLMAKYLRLQASEV